MLADLDQAALFGAGDEVKEYRLTAEQRRGRLATTAVAAAQLADRVRTYLATSPLAAAQRQPVATWLAHLDKILADEFTLTRDAQQHVTAAAELPKDQKGSYRLGSATDPDATYRVHDDQIDFGYNVNVAATQHFIREIQVATGAQPDPVAIPAVLQAEQKPPRPDASQVHLRCRGRRRQTFRHGRRQHRRADAIGGAAHPLRRAHGTLHAR